MCVANSFICMLVGILATQTQAPSISFDDAGITDITNITIPPNTTKVNFKKNEITLIPASYFKDLPDIHKIELQQNWIVDIQNNSFSQVPSLKLLWLGRNRLASLRKGMFANLTRLEWLTLNNNLIQNIQSQTFCDLKSLRRLDLQLNNLKSFDIASAFDPVNHPLDLDIWLFDNPWVCDIDMCAFVATLGGWYTVESRNNPPDLAQCRFPCALGGRLLNNLTAEDLSCTTQQCL